MTTILLRILLVALVGYGCVAIFLFFFADLFIFVPPRPTYGPATLPYTRVPVDETDSLALLHLHDPEAHFTILLSHGNGEDMGQIVDLFEEIRASGFSLLAYDYRGYGRSSRGRPTTGKATRDAEAVYRHAVRELGIPPERLILHGRSVGSGPTLEVAVRHPVAGIILESAFTTAFRVVTQAPLLPFDRFRNLERMRDVEAPVLVIHGTRDAVIRPWHGRRLYEAAKGPKAALWIEGGGHNDLLFVAREKYRQALRDFAELLLSRR